MTTSRPGRLQAFACLCSGCRALGPREQEAQNQFVVAVGAAVRRARRTRSTFGLLDVWGRWSPAVLMEMWQSATAMLEAGRSAAMLPYLLRASGPSMAEALAMAAVASPLGQILLVLDAQDLMLVCRASRPTAPDLVRLTRRRGALIIGLCCPAHYRARLPFARALSPYTDWAEPQPGP